MEFLYFDALPSTNTYLKEHLGLAHQTVASADLQTMGKGRLGRSWSTPKGNLSASILLHQPQGDFSLYPLLCAIAVYRLLARYTDKSIGIKWPNDLVIEGKKVCGILCESVIGGQISVICGIGVNLNMTAEQLAESNLPYGASLAMMTGKAYDNRAMVRELMELVTEVIAAYETEGFAKLKDEYEQHLVGRGQQVQVIYQGQTRIATCLGIADNGNLRCMADEQEFIVHSGEASVRGLYGYV